MTEGEGGGGGEGEGAAAHPVRVRLRGRADLRGGRHVTRRAHPGGAGRSRFTTASCPRRGPPQDAKPASGLQARRGAAPWSSC